VKPVTIMTSLGRKETYRHLQALCQNDTLFTIADYGDAWREGDWEKIVISDQQMVKRAGTARGAVIGTIRLLPAGGKTVTMFVSKDAIWHCPLSDGSAELFNTFIERAREHLRDAGVLIVPARAPPTELGQAAVERDNDLFQSLTGGTLTLFIGADLFRKVTSLPSRADLASPPTITTACGEIGTRRTCWTRCAPCCAGKRSYF